jgi:hypothetical protein
MDKRGDTPTLILVIGVFAVCALTILSFSLFSGSFMKSFDVLGTMASVNSIADQARFYENLGLNPGDYLSMQTGFDAKQGGNYYLISAEQDSGDQKVFYVEYKIPVKAPFSK